MKKKVLVFLSILIIFFINILSAYAKSNNVIRIGGDIYYPPYEFVDENGIYKGFNLDIMRAAAEQAGYNVELIPMKWSEAVDALKSGKIDAIQGVSNIDIRREKFIFSDPYTINEQAIFTVKDTTYINDVSDLKGKRVAIQKGDVCEELLKEISEIKILTCENQQAALKKLIDSEVDALIGNRIVGLYEVQKQNVFNKVKITGEPIFLTEYSLATTKDKQEIVDRFNKGLSEIKSTNTYDNIHSKWFGEAIGYSSYAVQHIINGVIIVGTLVIGIVTATLFINKSLKRKIEDRTKELNEVNKVIERDEERYKRFIEACPDAIFSHDLENKILFVNDEGRKLLGASNKSEIIGRNMKEFTPDMAYVEEMVGSYFSGKTVYNRNIRRLDGSLVEVEIRGSFASFGGRERILSIVRDISDRKRLYEAIEYDRIKTEFFSNISHELRTPLNVILASLQLMEAKAGQCSDCCINIDIHKNIESIRHNGHRLLRLVNNLIDITKIDSGYINLNMANGNIIEVIENTVSAVIEYAQIKNIQVTFDTEWEEIIMAFDEDKIERIMLNLLSNAVKFSKDNGEIFVDVKNLGDKVSISVKDNGIGIQEDKLKVVFERFRQVNKTLIRSFEGSGIGLSIVKSLVEMQGGEITVSSVYGKGTTFTVYIPIKVIDEDEESVSRSLISNKDMADIEFSDIT